MRGYARCERCDWARIYATFSVARIPIHCPACGRRVVRERQPSPDSPVIAHWRSVASGLGSAAGRASRRPPKGPA
jgi:hypothetical protein